ncbi:hypothetical protein ACTFIZ_008387 [Dictyostelium cf. discoideum]
MIINDGIGLEFSFEIPIINSILPTNGDYNTKVTINGNNFIKGQSVKIGDVLVNDIEFISNQKIIISAPFGFISRDLVVYSDDLYSLEEISFSYPSPIIDQVIFSNYQSKLNTTDTNYFTVIGRGLVKCKPISGTGINHKVIITVGNQDSNEAVYFSYDKPILDIKNYSSPTDGNTEITITGENFIENYNQEKHNETDNFVELVKINVMKQSGQIQQLLNVNQFKVLVWITK